jgi:hypothetical protein
VLVVDDVEMVVDGHVVVVVEPQQILPSAEALAMKRVIKTNNETIKVDRVAISFIFFVTILMNIMIKYLNISLLNGR